MNLDDLIEYENEHTGLDFKAVQYDKSKLESFLKDIVSMANAMTDSVRYIIVGVKHKPSGEREILSIRKDDFIDDAIYQQWVRENIEPEVKFTYEPYEYKGSLLGVFKIGPCEEKPYLMKKQFGKLKSGDAFIRRGSQQGTLLRSDFEKIYAQRNERDKVLKRKISSLQLLKDELQQNMRVFYDLKSYIGPGPIIDELWSPHITLSNHILFKAWDNVIQNDTLTNLDMLLKEVLISAAKQTQNAVKTIQTTAANWPRILNWNKQSLSVVGHMPRQLIPPEVTLVQMVNDCDSSISLALEAIQRALNALSE